MPAVKIIIGLLAVVWTVAHVVTAFTQRAPVAEPFVATSLIAKCTAILAGVLVALICFRPSKNTATKRPTTRCRRRTARPT